ncbi:hypothetical protein [Roseococcus sp.]|uniref:hypothetical protein n=1 Tax=Roseococcus sp. TaxID=2109646 RepID=UPI003BAD04F9
MSDVTKTPLEQQLEAAKAIVDRRQTAMRLVDNRDFRKLILEGFCLEDAARYAQESGDPILAPEQRADALCMAQASGHLKRFINITIQMGAHAERELPHLEEAVADERAAPEGDEEVG